MNRHFYAVMVVFLAAPAQAAYLPAPEQKALLEQRLELYGKYFPAGRMLQAGDHRKRQGAIAYWYKFGDDTLRWRLEEWVALPKGLYHLRIWDFQEDRAYINEDIVDGGILREIRFNETIPIDGKEASGVSQLTLKLLTEAEPDDYDRQPFPDVGRSTAVPPRSAFLDRLTAGAWRFP